MCRRAERPEDLSGPQVVALGLLGPLHAGPESAGGIVRECDVDVVSAQHLGQHRHRALGSVERCLVLALIVELERPLLQPHALAQIGAVARSADAGHPSARRPRSVT
jgi:hypothetical protein